MVSFDDIIYRYGKRKNKRKILYKYAEKNSVNMSRIF